MYKNIEGPIRVPFELSSLDIFSLATPTFLLYLFRKFSVSLLYEKSITTITLLAYDWVCAIWMHRFYRFKL